MARLSREQSQARTRERIVDAARQQVAQNGFGAATVRQIAEGAGFSLGAFYSNFASKEEIMLELMRGHMADEARALAAIVEGSGVDGARALEGLERWAETMNGDADWAMLAIELQLHANRNPDFAEEYNAVTREHTADLGALVERLFRALGKQPPDDPVAVANGLMAMVHGLALQRQPVAPDPGGGLLVVHFLKALLAIAPLAGA